MTSHRRRRGQHGQRRCHQAIDVAAWIDCLLAASRPESCFKNFCCEEKRRDFHFPSTETSLRSETTIVNEKNNSGTEKRLQLTLCSYERKIPICYHNRDGLIEILGLDAKPVESLGFHWCFSFHFEKEESEISLKNYILDIGHHWNLVVIRLRIKVNTEVHVEFLQMNLNNLRI